MPPQDARLANKLTVDHVLAGYQWCSSAIRNNHAPASGAKRARAGIWNANANAWPETDQHAVNVLLEQMQTDHRELLAQMLEQQFMPGSTRRS